MVKLSINRHPHRLSLCVVLCQIHLEYGGGTHRKSFTWRRSFVCKCKNQYNNSTAAKCNFHIDEFLMQCVGGRRKYITYEHQWKLKRRTLTVMWRREEKQNVKTKSFFLTGMNNMSDRWEHRIQYGVNTILVCTKQTYIRMELMMNKDGKIEMRNQIQLVNSFFLWVLKIRNSKIKIKIENMEEEFRNVFLYTALSAFNKGIIDLCFVLFWFCM